VVVDGGGSKRAGRDEAEERANMKRWIAGLAAAVSLWTGTAAAQVALAVE
jgi:hypothetical protein